jgi:hypothetical protein
MPMNRPTATELLSALRHSLERDGADSSDSGYERRVAINVLKILERETALGGSFSSDEQQGLRAHLGIDAGVMELNAALCDRIQAGREDPRWDELVALLKRITLGKLAIDNPAFAAYRRLIDNSRPTIGTR